MKLLSFLKITGALVALSISVSLVASPVFAQVSSVAPIDEVTTNTSYNWAGYVADQGTYTSVTGTWIIPTVAQSSSLTADAAWVGIGGIKSDDLIQAGTQTITDNSGQVSYQAWYETLPDVSQSIPLDIKPGDSVTVTLNDVGNNLWNISYRNNTTGKTYSINVNYSSSLSSAEWIEEMPSMTTSFIPLDNFGSISFSNGSDVDNGNRETISQSGAQSMTMINRNQQTLVTISPLGNDGQSFTATRTQASSAQVPQNRRGRRGWVRTVVPIQEVIPLDQPGSYSTTTQDDNGYTQIHIIISPQMAELLQWFNSR